ncbi:cation-transporting ATPase [Cryobacterium sp.]|uniref:cation-transporting ATPase n=1 Tax=Cryobacterium sp. TaxID=1926290 RepID=UPI002608C3C6|nr:cation-transporting ATPase [Cryobacterium sp.]MCU1447447.1 cation-transporting ATPase [Cryobacterium sp.]
MSNLQRILNMAAKALDKSGQSSAPSPANSGASGSRKTDWRDLVRTAADRVTGDSRPATFAPAAPRAAPQPAQSGNPEDAAAIVRYDYLLKTAQPEQLEQVHRDAFARLTPAQREQVSAQLKAELPATEHPASAEPGDLARAAARGEAHKPGFLRGLFAKTGGRGGAALAGAGVGAVAGAGLGAAEGLLAAVAGGAVLSSVAAPILEQAAGLGVDFENLAGGLGDLSAGAEDYAGGIGEQLSEAGSNFEVPSSLSDLGSNLEIPGLGDLGRFFGRG